MEWHHAKRESAMALTPRYTKFELTTLRATIFAEEDRHKFALAKGPEAASGISAPPISSALSITGRMRAPVHGDQGFRLKATTVSGG